jgi:excisionase family DNA binding protein
MRAPYETANPDGSHRSHGSTNASQAAASPEPRGGPSLLDELLTAAEVASILRLKVSTVEDYARRGVLPSVKVGRHRRFIRSELERAIADRHVSTP